MKLIAYFGGFHQADTDYGRVIEKQPGLGFKAQVVPTYFTITHSVVFSNGT